MATKFIDGIKQSEELYDDEVILRCACGCSFLCVRTYQYPDPTGRFFPALEIDNYGQFMTTTTTNLDFILPTDIALILNLLNKEVNNGNGALVDVEGKVLCFNHTDTEDNASLCIMAFKNQKKFKTFMKNPAKNGKCLNWNVLINEKDIKKFCEACTKIISKKFKDFLKKEPDNEEIQNN